MTSAASPRSRAPLLFYLLACAVACLALSSQSFWTDEAETALKALPPTLPGWWHALYAERNTNIQLPLYMLYIWGWARLFGVSELALRAANLPWFFLGLAAIAHFLRRHPSLRNTALLLYCIHPFVWYYLDEARPYLMELCASLLVFGALFDALDHPDDTLPPLWWWLFGAGVTILCGAGILGVPWAIAALLLLLMRRSGFVGSLARAGRPALLVFAPILGLIALFYAWTLEQKVHISVLDPGVRSVLSLFYEQIGFLGLGPGRLDLRTNDLSLFRAYLVPLALLGLPLAWGFMVAARKRFGLSPSHLASALLISAGPALLIFALGFLRHTRILARHLTPFFPFFLLAQACAILLLWRGGRPFSRAAAGLIVVMLAISSLQVRFAFRHSKDDERAACASAVQVLAQGKRVWWVAPIAGAEYYRLPFSKVEIPGYARWVGAALPHDSGLPDQIYLCRTDLSDATGSTAAFIAAHGYHIAGIWQAFTLWEK